MCCGLRVACAAAQTLLAIVVFKLSSTVTAGEMCNLIRGVPRPVTMATVCESDGKVTSAELDLWFTHYILIGCSLT